MLNSSNKKISGNRDFKSKDGDSKDSRGFQKSYGNRDFKSKDGAGRSGSGGLRSTHARSFQKKVFNRDQKIYLYREIRTYLRYTKDKQELPEEEWENIAVDDAFLSDEEQRDLLLRDLENAHIEEEEEQEEISIEEEEAFAFFIAVARKQTSIRVWMVQLLYTLEVRQMLHDIPWAEKNLDEVKKELLPYCFCDQFFMDDEKIFPLSRFENNDFDKKWLTIHKILKKLSEIDTLIADNLEGWRFERLSPTKKTILRLGISLLDEQIPFRVVLNEMIDLAKAFLTRKEHFFVNALLEKVYQKKNE